MTETLLQKLEEKTMIILTELERLRGEVKELRHENASLRSEKENSGKKLQDLVSLLESTSQEESLYLQSEASAA